MASLGLAGLLAAGPLVVLEERLKTAGGNADEIRGFVEAAAEGYGKAGERAALFLLAGMPEGDLIGLKKDFLLENLNLAMKAREEFPWAKTVPEEIFLNDVLPYASLDETRESWRPEFYATCRELVKDCRTATEAAQALNREFFKKYKVHYNTGRKRPNQSPGESKTLGMATCTGLSIILVDACRAVGVPARVAGIPLWPNKRGNHTWVEVWDGGWHFTGADEYNAQGLNKAWFTADASKAVADDWKHAIWATSWKKTDHHFPMVWDLKSREVAGVNVTERYTQRAEKTETTVPVHVRVFDKKGGERLVVKLEVLDDQGAVRTTATTKAGTADMNDMATVKVAPGRKVRLRMSHGGETRVVALEAKEEVTRDFVWSELKDLAAGVELTEVEQWLAAGLAGEIAAGRSGALPVEVEKWLALLPEERHLSVPDGALTKDLVKPITGMIFETLKNEAIADRKDELARRDATEDRAIKIGVVKAAGKEMKVLERTLGKEPEDGHSLWISMHGGGGAPARVNDQQWKNQIMLYSPKEGIYVAPRAPTDTWNLWHQGHMDALLDRMIANYVIDRGIDPDRVYLMGYSAGGDGVYQLAPRMADRFAAASMMAGHPNDASPLGLRNLPFMIWMGEKDGAYKRNQVAAEWGMKLDELEAGDPGGYVHETHLVKGKGHWMDREDAAAVPWMAKRSRVTWPKKVVWHQSGRTHDRFYWLAVPEGSAERGQTVRAEVGGQKIVLKTEGVPKLRLRLSDALLDLDQEIAVELNGKEVFRGVTKRSVAAIFDSLKERLDPKSVATAELVVEE